MAGNDGRVGDMAESAINEKTVKIVQENKCMRSGMSFSLLLNMVSDMIHGEKSIVLDPKAETDQEGQTKYETPLASE